MPVLIRLWMKNRDVSFQQALAEIKARLLELKKDKSINAVAFLITAEKQSMLTNELDEFEAQFGQYSGSLDSGCAL